MAHYPLVTIFDQNIVFGMHSIFAQTYRHERPYVPANKPKKPKNRVKPVAPAPSAATHWNYCNWTTATGSWVMSCCDPKDCAPIEEPLPAPIEQSSQLYLIIGHPHPASLQKQERQVTLYDYAQCECDHRCESCS